MKKVLFLVLMGIVITFTVLGVQSSIELAKTEVMTIEDYQQENGIPVVTVRPEIRTLQAKLGYTGSLRGIEQADISAAVNIEKVKTIHVKPGDKVRTNALLITLDSRITAANRQIYAALEDSKRDLERMSELLKAGAVSRQMLDKAELAVKVNQAEWDAAQWRTKINSPLAGTVTDVFVEKGQTVTAGLPVARVAQLNKMIVEIQVAESDIAVIKKEQTATITVRSYPDRNFAAVVSEIAYSTNAGARNFAVELEVENGDLLLKPGMFASVELVVHEVTDAIAIPVDALVRENGSVFVYIVNSDMTVRKVSVVPQLNDGLWIEIVENLSVDDIIVIEGQNKLSDGAKVTVISE